jgi:hypothetical protein
MQQRRKVFTQSYADSDPSMKLTEGENPQVYPVRDEILTAVPTKMTVFFV